jgi:hypothetical protein
MLHVGLTHQPICRVRHALAMRRALARLSVGAIANLRSQKPAIVGEEHVKQMLAF